MKYPFERRYGEIFKKAGVDVEELLRQARLPEDLFDRRDVQLSRREYYRLVEALGRMAENLPDLARYITDEGRIETFSPPLFAAYCSQNGLMFVDRFARYKQLVGPISVTVSRNRSEVCMEVASDDEHTVLPSFFAELEIRFVLHIIRKSTQTDVAPIYVERRATPSSSFIDDVQCPLHTGGRDAVIFRTSDLQLPFATRNDAMLQYIEPELRRRLSEVDIDDTMVNRVRSALVELLPLGKPTLDAVAAKLYLSKRTLQRRLTDEDTTFQQELNATRLLLTKHYLTNEDRTADDIAFLLGYEDTTSLLRAFNAWTGQTMSAYKRSMDDGERGKNKKS